jgi:hypothetical protein
MTKNRPIPFSMLEGLGVMIFPAYHTHGADTKSAPSIKYKSIYSIFFASAVISGTTLKRSSTIP